MPDLGPRPDFSAGWVMGRSWRSWKPPSHFSKRWRSSARPRSSCTGLRQAVIFDFVRDAAADIAGFCKDFRSELVLDVHGEFIRLVRLEIPVKGFAGAGRNAVDPRIPRLRQILNRRGERRIGSIHADSENSGRIPKRSGSVTAAPASVAVWSAAGIRLE